MVQATYVRTDREGFKWYRCWKCNAVFRVVPLKGWANCFYCSTRCASEYNACSGCGNNRHFACTCGDEG